MEGEKYNNESQELSPEEREALAKVIDFNAPENQESIVFHLMGSDGPESKYALAPGIFNAEQILKQGLVSKTFGDRTKIQRNPFGYNPDNPYINGPDGISTHIMKPYRFGRATNLGDISEGDDRGREFAFVIRKKPYHKSYTLDRRESILKRRVKPRDIIGIDVRKRVLDLDIREFLLGVSPTAKLYKKLLQTAKNLHIEIPSETQEYIDASVRENTKFIDEYCKEAEEMETSMKGDDDSALSPKSRENQSKTRIIQDIRNKAFSFV